MSSWIQRWTTGISTMSSVMMTRRPKSSVSALRLVQVALARGGCGPRRGDARHLGGVPAMTELVRISEIFGPTIQGEGPLIGRPSVFVRTAGCDYRCAWCDTLYAVLPEFRDEWVLRTPPQIMTRVNELARDRPVLVSLSGGNPALHPLAPVIALGRRYGHSFALETQGSMAQAWFAELDWLILSPKPPSSGMTTYWNNLENCLTAAQGKPR